MKITLLTQVSLLGVLLLTGVAVATPIQLAPTPPLTGGTSDPSTVTGGNPLAYTVYGQDKDTITGTNTTMDLTLWNSDHIIESIPIHSVQHQGDDTNTGKRTWTVSGTAATFSGNNTCYDKFRFDDYPVHSEDASDGQFIYGDDSEAPGNDEWYVKTVFVNQ